MQQVVDVSLQERVKLLIMVSCTGIDNIHSIPIV
jgi:hypothetical protein